ncbi:MAG TPA: diacylglycerol kinase family protein [Longimicrobiales bacterium]|nr:diacylglycerol kinase family protein [Longimicrobiales bacterium]
MPKTARVILNPTSGGGRGGRSTGAILAGLERRGISAEIRATTAPREAAALALAAAREGVDIVVAAGGDGTVHEVANGLLRGREEEGLDGTVLGVLPVGTGNDFAKLVGPLKQFEASLDILAAGAVRRLDAGRALWRDEAHWFVNAAGTGIDVEVVRQILLRRGGSGPAVAKYLLAVLRALVRYRPIPLRIRMDDRVLEADVMIVAAANGRCIGGGFWVCPAAEPDDGRFDICIVRRTSFLEALWAIPLILRGVHERHPKVEMHRAKGVDIEALGAAPLFFQLDGELHEPPDVRSIRFEVVPGALPVLASPEAA